jgi:hypothetical protein
MTPEQFTYWMQGYVELNNGAQPTAEQWQMIQEHLKTVFHKVTPPYPQPPSVFGPLPTPLPNDLQDNKLRVIC